jgi:signal peptidase I
MLRLRRRLFTVTVSGHSMEPTFLDGDRLLACRVPCWMIMINSVVVAAAPPWLGRPRKPGRNRQAATGATGQRWVVKRVHTKWRTSAGSPAPLPQFTSEEAALAPHRLYLVGDAAQSVDSHDWGPCPCSAVVGVVVLRYMSPVPAVAKADD